MKKIKVFLASSNELKPERERFEIETYRKCKDWIDKGIFLHLEIWEDLTARMSQGGSQSAYNKLVQEADLFVLLAYTKVGQYTEEEFNNAIQQFNSTQKPFIYVYFKKFEGDEDPSLLRFKKRLEDLKYFYTIFENNDALWNHFNKELEDLDEKGFKEYERTPGSNVANVKGDGNITIQGVEGSQISINTGNTTNQQADKIYNIDKIDKADFS